MHWCQMRLAVFCRKTAGTSIAKRSQPNFTELLASLGTTEGQLEAGPDLTKPQSKRPPWSLTGLHSKHHARPTHLWRLLYIAVTH